MSIWKSIFRPLVASVLSKSMTHGRRREGAAASIGDFYPDEIMLTPKQPYLQA